jgi:Flp pilus assembly protein TadG
MFRLRVMLNKLRRFRDDAAAVAAVEFALVLPLLIGLYLGTIEAATFYSADQKVATIASTMADLVSRQKEELKESDLTNFFKAAQNIMQPYTDTNLTQVVSLLALDSAGNATVTWSKAYGTGATARTASSTYTLDKTSKINVLAREASGYLVVAEINYPRQPITGYIFPSSITLRHVEYYLPRFESEIKLLTGQ